MSPRELVQLGDVATIVRKTMAPERISDGTTYVGLENIERGGAFLNVTSVSRGDLASTKFEFTADQVLFGKLRPYLAKIARPAFSGVCSTDILPITPGPRLDKNYLAQYLVTPDVVALAASRATGANLPRLSPGELAKFEIPLPPLEEQRRIAEILDQVDALRAKRREALAHLDEVRQSIYLDMFGHPAAPSPGIAAQPLDELCTMFSGFAWKSARFSDVPIGLPVIRIQNVAAVRDADFAYWPDRFDERFVVRAGDLLLTLSGSFRVAEWRGPDALLNQRIVRISPRVGVEKGWLLNALRLLVLQIESMGRHALVNNVALSDLRTLSVGIPSLALQRVFCMRARAVEKVMAINQAQLSEVDGLFRSLQNQAFAGEL